ncbi:MAG: hypothetical protein ABTS22_15550 [Accumulibacter sp.]
MRSYQRDFLVQTDGSYLIFGVKDGNMIDNAVVQANASGMNY